MALIVQKFGGTSVGDIDRIEGVADRLLETRLAGDDSAVVLSAMAGETDRLLGLARAISTHGRPNPRELDVLLATGEQVTIALLCMALEKRGITARSFNGQQAGIVTDSGHNKARIEAIDPERLRHEIALGRIPVIAGFQGADASGNITTLGRGGSDTTAVAVAAALEARECRIFTDVEGVFTADPRIEPNARCQDRVSCEEMLELAAHGAKVLQIRSVELAQRFRVPLRVLSTFGRGAGTLILEGERGMEAARVAGIASSREEAEISLSGVPGGVDAAWRLLAPLAASRVEIDMMYQAVAPDGTLNFAFTVGRQDYDQAVEILSQIFRGMPVMIEGNSRVAKVTLVGHGIRSDTDIGVRMLRTLASVGIRARQIVTAQLRISVIVDEAEMERAVRALHQEFRLQEACSTLKTG